MELAARIDALSIELEQRHEELKRHITQTVEHAIVPLLQHVEANSGHGSRCSSRTVSRAASCADVLRSSRAVAGASPTRGSVSGKWGSALAKARLMSKSGANASPCGTASGSTSLETPSPARRRSSLDRACSMGDLLHENRNKRRSSTPAVVQYDDGGGGGASGGSGDRARRPSAGGRSAHFAPDVVAPPAADTWDDDDELLEGSVTQMVVTDVRPDA